MKQVFGDQYEVLHYTTNMFNCMKQHANNDTTLNEYIEDLHICEYTLKVDELTGVNMVIESVNLKMTSQNIKTLKFLYLIESK